MAFFDRSIECANKIQKRIRDLGNGNNKIYKNGREVSSSSIPDFAKQNLWFLIVHFKTANMRFSFS